MAESPDIVYRVNDRDEIVCVNPAWDLFALANNGDSIVADRVLRRPLWDFIADHTTRELYRQILHRARSGRALRFPFRCDSPSRRRWLEMEVSRSEDETVQFLTRTLAEEKRPPIAIPEPTGPRSGEMVRVCSWCKKVAVGETWEEVEKAVADLRLFERPPPAMTHGICHSCFDQMMAALDRASEQGSQ